MLLAETDFSLYLLSASLYKKEKGEEKKWGVKRKGKQRDSVRRSFWVYLVAEFEQF